MNELKESQESSSHSVNEQSLKRQKIIQDQNPMDFENEQSLRNNNLY